MARCLMRFLIHRPISPKKIVPLGCIPGIVIPAQAAGIRPKSMKRKRHTARAVAAECTLQISSPEQRSWSLHRPQALSPSMIHTPVGCAKTSGMSVPAVDSRPRAIRRDLHIVRNAGGTCIDSNLYALNTAQKGTFYGN